MLLFVGLLLLFIAARVFIYVNLFAYCCVVFIVCFTGVLLESLLMLRLLFFVLWCIAVAVYGCSFYLCVKSFACCCVVFLVCFTCMLL